MQLIKFKTSDANSAAMPVIAVKQSKFEPELEFMTNNNAFDHFLSTSGKTVVTETRKVTQQVQHVPKCNSANLDRVIDEVASNFTGKSNDHQSSTSQNAETEDNNQESQINYEASDSKSLLIDNDLVNILSVKPFTLMYNNAKDVTLPNSLWGFHKTLDEEMIVFSRLKFMKSEVPIPPVYDMQVKYFSQININHYK